MTLDAAEVNQVTEIAARVAAEMTRNAWRGTGGATMPLQLIKYGTVGSRANAGAEVSVRADGDPVAIPAINETGMVLEAGDRVAIEWRAPNGVYVTHQLARASRGNWTPVLGGPSSANGSGVAAGHYTRLGHRVMVYGVWTFGTGAAMGTAAQITGLPFPVISDGDGLTAILNCYLEHGATWYPAHCLVSEGATLGTVNWFSPFGGAATFYSAVASGGPFTWATGDKIRIHAIYDTDAG